MRDLIYYAVGFCVLVICWGALPLQGQILVRISAAEPVYQVSEVQGTTWLATESGAYRIEGDAAIPVLEDMLVTQINQGLGGEIWLGTWRGVFRGDGTPQAILQDKVGPLWITAIEHTDDGSVWLGTQRGLYYIENDYTVDLVLKGLINALSTLNGNMWVGTQENLFRVTPTTRNPPGFFDEKKDISEIVQAGGLVWVTTKVYRGRFGPCYGYQDDRLVETISELEVISVTEVDGEPWLATTQGIFRRVNSDWKRIAGQKVAEPVNRMKVIDNEVWIGTSQRVFRKSEEEIVGLLAGARNFKIFGLGKMMGEVWAWGQSGAYRYDEDVQISLQPSTISLFGQELLLGRTLRIKEVRYESGGLDPYGQTIEKRFGVIVHPDRERFEKEIELYGFTPAESFERIIAPGFQDLHMMVRDSYGNVSIPPSRRSIVVIPGKTIILIVTPILWGLISLFVLLMSPWWKPCMSTLMVRSIRRHGSLWIIPVALSFAFVRRYLLRRYTRNLLTSKDFETRQVKESVGSDIPATICGKLGQYQRIVVSGNREIARASLKAVVRLISARECGRNLNGLVPVLLRLDLYEENKEAIETGAAWQLSDFGGITDLELARDILRQDGFVFVLDGLGNVSEIGLKAVEQFVDGARDGNWFVLGIEDLDSPHPEGFIGFSLNADVRSSGVGNSRKSF